MHERGRRRAAGALHLPHWVEAELVLSLWWAGWAAVLTTLLYRGFRLSDDHVLAAPRFDWPSRRKTSEASGCDPVGCIDLGGWGEALLGALLLVVTFAASWLVVELVVPALFFLSYLLVRGALARVTNDDHACAGRFPIASGLGHTLGDRVRPAAGARGLRRSSPRPVARAGACVAHGSG